jgi:hypothetical protein
VIDSLPIGFDLQDRVAHVREVHATSTNSELTSTPNDFNVLTINSFIESGAVKIPGFQRNYVWDIKRASKLIESLILSLSAPQTVLYEEERNRFLVIDGQQRMMSMYYVIKGRFPRKEHVPSCGGSSVPVRLIRVLRSSNPALRGRGPSRYGRRVAGRGLTPGMLSNVRSRRATSGSAADHAARTYPA